MHAVARPALFAALAALLLSTLTGCGQSTTNPATGETAPDAAKTAGDHSGWWCVEHRVPEEICGQCDPKVAAEMQKKGDWCRQHDRPDSQCFACHPELETQFAAQYEAKYGEKPPKPEG
jgi:cobalt-zinc-cadmium efflux system membrane fusion protein